MLLEKNKFKSVRGGTELNTLSRLATLPVFRKEQTIPENLNTVSFTYTEIVLWKAMRYLITSINFKNLVKVRQAKLRNKNIYIFQIKRS